MQRDALQASADEFAALFNTAENWLRAQGMKRALGPFSFSINDEIGLLIDGFETMPNMMMGHAPRYYQARVEEQGYIHYRKGSVVMYRLQDEIGEDAVNRALRRVLAKFAFKGPPYPTSSDLIAAIRAEAPADKQDLITDLFEKITLYDIKTTKVASRKRADGRYDVTLTVSARKLYADGRGKETEAPLNEQLDVGLFDSEPGKAGFTASKVIAFQRMPIRSGVQTIHLVAARAPAFAGVDPYNKLIDRNSDDNVLKAGA